MVDTSPSFFQHASTLTSLGRVHFIVALQSPHQFAHELASWLSLALKRRSNDAAILYQGSVAPP